MICITISAYCSEAMRKVQSDMVLISSDRPKDVRKYAKYRDTRTNHERMEIMVMGIGD